MNGKFTFFVERKSDWIRSDPDHKIANVFCLFIVYVGALLKGAPFFFLGK